MCNGAWRERMGESISCTISCSLISADSVGGAQLSFLTRDAVIMEASGDGAYLGVCLQRIRPTEVTVSQFLSLQTSVPGCVQRAAAASTNLLRVPPVKSQLTQAASLPVTLKKDSLPSESSWRLRVNTHPGFTIKAHHSLSD